MKLRALAVCLVIVGGLAVAGSAAASCRPTGSRDPSSGHWWSEVLDGPNEAANCLTRTYANILNTDQYIYNGEISPGPTFAYVMLISETNNNHYAQVGWQEFTDGTRSNFTEYRTSETDPHYVHKSAYGASTLGTAPEYKMTFVQTQTGNKWFHFFIDGVDKLDYMSNSYAGCGVEQGGEIQNLANQMPGTLANPDAFTNPNVWDTANGYHETSGSAPHTGDSYGHLSGSFGNQRLEDPPLPSPVYEFDIWDTCS